ncbi:inactive serine protease 35 [Chanos chanos]|uniref:Inactive serine protease 35 n=1 Tax=Chanos chanos TaxID=29144 RepID=A0A6J2WFV7_CHACN|nr:inactive serine protease 35-like [Chanos chanos]
MKRSWWSSMMGPDLWSLLLCVMGLGLVLPVVWGSGDGNEEYNWIQTNVPLVLDRHTAPLHNPDFQGEDSSKASVMCGIECQSGFPEPGTADLERLLSYETVYENGTRTLTEVSLQGLHPINTSTQTSAISDQTIRRKRQVYGMDGRFVITDKHFATKYPFAASVKLSTGCSGILVSPRHVLTAAHCVHDGQDYLKESKRLRVGVLKLRSKRRGGGRRGGKRRQKDGMRVKGKEREKRRGKRRKNRPRRSAKSKQPTMTSTETKQPSFRWTRVKLTQVPKGWIKAVGQNIAVDYNYALLELKRPHKMKYMDLGVVPAIKEIPAGRIHFSGFDDDQSGTVVYRFCSVSEESNHLIYQYCDAEKGSSGAGVYVRLRDPNRKQGERAKWKRKVIGVFTGHQSVEVNGRQQDYNVAVRITPLKYAQICHWIHGDPKQCQQV